ncbi:MAG: class I SAM-dependent methyltransferase [Vicinamibacteria bacterium]|nr:class I SAM-dependent methyltransferase [Vicinamibacteria bacterium]
MKPPLLYRDLAPWWHLFSSPADYRLETRPFRRLLTSCGNRPAKTLLELGSGGGNNASYLKKWFDITLVDLSAGMIETSRRLNPECAHVQGDMRTIRLGRTFDRVFIHDAIMHMTTERDLVRALRTAFVHTRPGGAALVAPDCTRETYAPLTHHGGNDGLDRGLRYLEWNFDPDPGDSRYEVHFVYLLRDSAGRVKAHQDVHEFGLFSKAEWLRAFRAAGFKPRCIDDPVLRRDVFAGLRPA